VDECSKRVLDDDIAQVRRTEDPRLQDEAGTRVGRNVVSARPIYLHAIVDESLPGEGTRRALRSDIVAVHVAEPRGPLRDGVVAPTVRAPRHPGDDHHQRSGNGHAVASLDRGSSPPCCQDPRRAWPGSACAAVARL
jgi:hypothetical protein